MPISLRSFLLWIVLGSQLFASAAGASGIVWCVDGASKSVHVEFSHDSECGSHPCARDGGETAHRDRAVQKEECEPCFDLAFSSLAVRNQNGRLTGFSAVLLSGMRLTKASSAAVLNEARYAVSGVPPFSAEVVRTIHSTFLLI